MIVRQENEIFKRTLSNVLARTQLSDIRETDVIVKVCAAFASEVAKGDVDAWSRRNEGFIDGTAGTLLDDLLAEFLPSGQTRGEGAYASGGDIEFYRPQGSSGALTVVAGTLVKRRRDGMIYKTLADATFGVTDLTSSVVPVVCSIKGSRGNAIVTGEIDTLATAVPGVSSCSNTLSITNGADRDSDETARDSAREYIKSISPATHAGIKKRTLDYTSETYGGVRFAKWEPVDIYNPGYQTLYIDDGNGTSGPITARNTDTTEEFTAFLENGNYTIFTRYKPLYSTPEITYNTGTAVTSSLWANALGQGQVVPPTTPTNGVFEIGTYSTYDGLVGEVQGMINGVVNDVDDSGISGAGLMVTIKPAIFSAYTTIGANVLFADNSNVTNVTAQIKAKLVTDINTLWNIGTHLTIADITTIVRSVAGVIDITDITIDGDEASKYAASYEVIRTRTDSINIL